MKAFDNSTCFARSGRPVRAAILLLGLGILFGPGLGCVTVDKYGNPIDVEEDRPERKYTLAEMKPVPAWGEDDQKVPIVLAGIPEDPPLKFMLTDLPPVGNQGRQASGTAWAAGYTAATHNFRAHHQLKDYRCSPAYVYNQLNSGEDNGVEILDALKLLSAGGCPEFKRMPYAEKDYLRRPGPSAFLAAGNYVIKGYGRVDFTDINQVRAHLLQRRVVIATMRITYNFIQLDERLWKSPAGPPVGRHTVAVVGYNHDTESVIIQNSAGEKWGDDGYAEVPYEWFIRLTGKAYVLW